MSKSKESKKGGSNLDKREKGFQRGRAREFHIPRAQGSQRGSYFGGEWL